MDLDVCSSRFKANVSRLILSLTFGKIADYLHAHTSQNSPLRSLLQMFSFGRQALETWKNIADNIQRNSWKPIPSRKLEELTA